MNAAVKCLCSLMLFVVTTSCENPDSESFTLRQIMREDDGTLCKKVYNIPGQPGKEFVEIYFRDGVLKEQYYRCNGQLNGSRVTYYANGQLSETGNWRNDQRTGIFIYYRIDGQLDCTQNFSLLGETISK
jgi:antitoxin component YwqK of YwqJK toxin-antitoxin module